jgi:BlaI family penicillinase repressor
LIVDITKAEFEVLNAIWQGSPCSASDIFARLGDQVEWHEKTVKTLLGRLVKKQAIGFRKEKRHYLYFPMLAKEAFQQKESTNLLNKLFGGKISPLVASFASQKQLDKDDVEQLKKLIADWEQDND